MCVGWHGYAVRRAQCAKAEEALQTCLRREKHVWQNRGCQQLVGLFVPQMRLICSYPIEKWWKGEEKRRQACYRRNSLVAAMYVLFTFCSAESDHL